MKDNQHFQDLGCVGLLAILGIIICLSLGGLYAITYTIARAVKAALG